MNLEQVLEGFKEQTRVYILSELGWDTEYFNHKAYNSLISVMQNDENLTGVLIDGAVTRLDRPEYLNDDFTFWDSSDEECSIASREVKNRKQYRVMMDTQIDLVKQRLNELRSRLPDAQLVLSLDSDDLQYSLTAILKEELLNKQSELDLKITEFKNTRRHQKIKRKQFEQDYKRLQTKKGKRRDRWNLNKRINTCTRKIDGLEESIQNVFSEKKMFREQKVRPAHQLFTRKAVKHYFERYQQMCDDLDITLITDGQRLDFNGLIIDYAHSRHKTWGIIKSRDRALERSVHGKHFEGVDVLLESGHHGIGYKQFVKLRDTVDETNFKHQGTYSQPASEDNITIIMALPFEDREKISEYVKGKKNIRMTAGKPIATRKIAAIDRYCNDSVTGLTVITKDGNGIIGTEWTQFQEFNEGLSSLISGLPLIGASSDEHIGSPESSPIARKGWVALYKALLTNQVNLRSSGSFIKSYINGGDIAEANSRKWQDRYHHKKNPDEMLAETVAALLNPGTQDTDNLIDLALKLTNNGIAGGIESMNVILDQSTDYMEEFILSTLQHSDQEHVAAFTTGNHTDAVLRDLGMKVHDYLVQRLIARDIGYERVGEPKRHNARVFLGGYSNARVLQMQNYGEGINILVQHDPKGGHVHGMVGAGRNAEADLVLAGHTHENKMRLFNTGDNTFSVAYRLATMQGVTATEKYYASSVPRTQGAHLLYMPKPGDFVERTIPSHIIKGIGRDILRQEVVLCQK